MMGKIVRKLMLDSIYAVGRNESWFTDMSKRGLHLKKFGRLFVYFEKGEPKDTRYRMDIFMQAPSQERLDMYEECGWHLVGKNGCFYVFAAEDVANISELHTDPVEQGHTLEELNRLLKRNTMIFSIAMVLLLGMIFGMYFLVDEPVLFMVRGQIVQQLLLIGVELYAFASGIRNYLSIRNLKKSLMQGSPIDHHEDYRKARFYGGTMGLLFNLMAVCSLIIPFVSMEKSIEYTLPEETVSLPIVRLSQIETSDELVRDTHYISRGIDFRNRVESDWSPLAPVQYEIAEHGVVAGEMWGDKSGEYSPSIRTQFYRLTYDGLSEPLVKDLINRYIWEDEIEILEIPYPGMDKVLLAEDDIRKQIFACQGDKVMYVSYYGNADIAKIIPLVMQQMISFEGEHNG
jgi:hypothetical protein